MADDDGCFVSPLLPRRSVAGVGQDELVDPKELADADSCFCEFNGVDLHHKICSSAAGEDEKVAGIRVPAVLLHGFGASAFSWDRVMQPLGRMVMADVLAFDRPAFGLTSRTAAAATGGLNPYSMIFSVLATLFFIDRLATEKKGEKAILIGHSAGCFVAVETYFKSPEKVAALVLVSPAIFAPVAGGRIGKERRRNRNVSRFLRFLKALTDLRNQLVWVIFAVLKAMRGVAGSLFAQAVLTKFLRSSRALMLVRMIVDKFGISAIRVSWFDQSKITDYVIQGYTKPLKAKGWERAFLEYTLSLLTNSSSSSSSKPKPPLSERLAQISCPVLIITGDSDRVVPAWNAKRLSLAIPGSRLEVIEECGHLPHEEKVDEFLIIVEKFLGRAFAAVSDQPQSVDAPPAA